jgi:protein involved in polysaccharide export with SLBB domain
MTPLLSLLCVLSVAISNLPLSTRQTNQSPPNDEMLITITGAILYPGKLHLHRKPISLLEVIAMSGGPTERARGTVQLTHNVKGGTQLNTGKDAKPEIYDLTQLLRTDPNSAPFIVSGDQIFLPGHDYIKVEGKVLRPSRYVMDTPVRVSEAIRLAGGVSQDAAKVIIVRCSEPHVGLSPRELSISLKDLYRKKSKDIYLGANDIVSVRTSLPYINDHMYLCTFL